MRYRQGDPREWRVVRVPTVAAQDARQLSRAPDAVTRDRTRVINGLKGLLASHGARLRIDASWPQALEAVRVWNGTPLPPGLRARLCGEWARLEQLTHCRRELGALAGLVPTHYQSGDTQRDLGISRAGNTHVRRVQLAWT